METTSKSAAGASTTATNVRRSSFFTTYLPTIITGVAFGITYIRYTPDYAEEEDRNYRYYLSWAPTILIETLFIGTAISNLLFGRRPSNDNHYNPMSDRMVQGVGRVFPALLAGATGIGRMVATTVAGERAAASNHMAVLATIAADHAARAVTVDNRLYNHGMDRSPSLNGAMRFLERVAYHSENRITYLVELAAEGLYLAMESGVIRLTLNDDNRLTVIAGLYYGADATEYALVSAINEYAYYAERYVDISVISRILLDLRIANVNPIIAFTPRPTAAQEVAAVVDGAEQVMHDLGTGVQAAVNGAGHLAHNLGAGAQAVVHGAENLAHDLGSGVVEVVRHARASITGRSTAMEVNARCFGFTSSNHHAPGDQHHGMWYRLTHLFSRHPDHASSAVPEASVSAAVVHNPLTNDSGEVLKTIVETNLAGADGTGAIDH